MKNIPTIMRRNSQALMVAIANYPPPLHLPSKDYASTAKTEKHVFYQNRQVVFGNVRNIVKIIAILNGQSVKI